MLNATCTCSIHTTKTTESAPSVAQSIAYLTSMLYQNVPFPLRKISLMETRMGLNPSNINFFRKHTVDVKHYTPKV